MLNPTGKEKINLKKHGISFTQAKEAVMCGNVVVLKEEVVLGEQQFVFLGMCKNLNILVVVVVGFYVFFSFFNGFNYFVFKIIQTFS